VRFTLGQNADITISIFDLVGREIAPAEKMSNQMAGMHESKLDVSALQPGTYLVRISADKKVETKRLSVIK
jgi:hypothetical protein